MMSALLIGGLVSSLNAYQVEFATTLSKKVSDNDTSVQDKKLYYGVRADLYFHEKGALQVGFETSRDNVMSDTGKTDKERYTVNGLYEPFGTNTARRLKPYMFAGAGYEKIHREIPGASSQAFIDGGAGFKIRLTPRIDLLTEARLVHGLEDKDDDLMGTIGVGVKFGSSQKKCKSAVVIPSKPIREAEMAQLCKPKQWGKPVQVAQPKPVIVEEKVAAVTPETVKRKECPTVPVLANGIYVQVVALEKYSADPIVKRLRRAHIPFTLKADRGMTKVLAGPYVNRAEAKKALRKIRRIRRDAFITRVN